jgi:hypothetical protein
MTHSEMKSRNNNTVSGALFNVSVIEISHYPDNVQKTVAQLLIDRVCPNAAVVQKRFSDNNITNGTLRVSVNARETVDSLGASPEKFPKEREWLYFQIDENGTGSVLSSGTGYLYMLGYYIVEDLSRRRLEEVRNGLVIPVTFNRHRPYYDHYLNQHARTINYLNHDEYFENLARMGFSHAEVNGIASPVQFETGPKGEVLHRFYTYCHALDQFVSSKLNKDIYKPDLLTANLNYLKKNAGYAEKYGLRAGMVCFEPRSVPETLLQKYPMLRGARVDHPLRSFQPRYNLSIAHPVVQEHYAEMMEKLLHEVPILDYISICSNDSGAGFEYTNSLYVGRNGGGYVIREWKGDTEIAEAAALNLVRFLKILRDAGRRVNPEFRVAFRIDPFGTEHDFIVNNLDEGIDLEFLSLISRDLKLNYRHPNYEDVQEIQNTVLHYKFIEKEKPLIREYNERGIGIDIMYTPDVLWNHEPLVGIPYPYLVYEKLVDMARNGVTSLCHQGGVTPPVYLDRNINQEVVRNFQLNRSLDLEELLIEIARKWVGENRAADLVTLWKLSDDTLRTFPIPVWLYTAIGVWYRLLTRPIIPDIEAVSEDDRAYYEDFLLATAHNRTRVDFRYDVGFELSTSQKAMKAMHRMNADLFPLMRKTLALSKNLLDNAPNDGAKIFFSDLYNRFTALNCWFRNQRNIAVWIAGVHGYLETEDEGDKRKYRALLHDMVLDEIENTKQLLELWKTTDKRWMYYSAVGETTFIYGDNFGDCLEKKIKIMTGRENDEPYIDPLFQWRVPGVPGSYKPKSRVREEW